MTAGPKGERGHAMANYAPLNVCPVCSKSYKRPEHLRRHQLSHGTDRPHECTHCGSTFQRSDVLKRHLKTCDSLADDDSGGDSVEPRAKRVAHSTSRPPQQPTPSFLQPHGEGFHFLASSDQNVFRHDSAGAGSFSQLAGWISCGLPDQNFEESSESWQDFLDLTSGIQSPHVASGEGNEDDANRTLKFLANFTSKTGLVTFDCGTLEQRRRVGDSVGSATLAASTIPTSTGPSLGGAFGDATVSAIHDDRSDSAQASVHQWLSDPLSLKSHEIISSIKDTVLHKAKNSCVTLSWSPTVNDGCVRFFSPTNLRRYLHFYWAIWHPNVNFVHKPTFDAVSAKRELVAAMAVIGACVSPEPSDLEEARRWFNCVEEMVFTDDDLCDDTPTPVCRDTGEVQWRREKLRALQAAYMVCLYQNWEGTASSKRRIRRYRYSTVVAAGRDIGIHNARHPDYRQLMNLCDFSWEGFAVREELIRVLLWIFLLDTAFVIFNNLPPRMVIREMTMSPAKPESCFQAMTAEACFHALRQQLKQQQSNNNDDINGLYIVSAVEVLYQPYIDEVLSTSLADLGPLNLFAMTSALHSLIFHYQNSFSCQGSLASIQQAQKTWETVWAIYTARFSKDPRHAPVTSSMQDLAPNEMWKRVGFIRYADEYWLLSKLMVDRLLKTFEGANHDAIVDPASQGQRPVNISGPESVSPLLNQYDQTSMQQINALISDFQKVCIRSESGQ